jgi:hypothetical protein
MERATFLTSWREKKLKGLLIGARAPPATRPRGSSRS